MALSPLDRDRLQQALALARDAIGVSEPNPRVGCVIGSSDGQVLGAGHTQHIGGPHAEIVALRDALSAGKQVRGAQVWVTLEPCAHHGRTPPCCDALIDAGVARVVIATPDPFAKVDGQGIARMRAAGIEVVLADADIAAAAREINVGFFSRVMRQRPWVRMKVATSLDGRTALTNGASQWITGKEARLDGHVWRKRAGAVLTGIGTVLADDPRLDVRLVPTQVQPLRVILDSQLRLPPSAAILGAPGRSLIIAAAADARRSAALADAGAEVLSVSASAGGVDLADVMAHLCQREINELHVEAGANLNGALLQGGWVDELLLYQAPVLLGAGPGLAELGELKVLADAPRFALHHVLQVGEDLRILARRPAGVAADAFASYLAGTP